MAKAPSFQFYPEDWLSNIKLQLCSMTAHGLLINLMCLMHQSEKYGYLIINGSIPDHKTIKDLLRMHFKTFNKALSELILSGVLKEDENGAIYCERMVKDEQIRNVRRKSGKLGGNPNLKKIQYLDNQEVNQEVNQEDNQKATPSARAFSSSSSKEKSFLTERLKEVGLSVEKYEILIDEFGKEKIDYYIERIKKWEGDTGKKIRDPEINIRKWIKKNGVKPIEKSSESLKPESDVEAYRKYLKESKREFQCWFKGEVLDKIKDEINKQSFETWFKPLIAIEVKNKTLYLHVPKEYFISWIKEHYNGLLEEALQKAKSSIKRKSDKKSYPENIIITSEIPEKYRIKNERII